MSTNISKEKRERLIQKINAIKTYISSATQDENTAQLTVRKEHEYIVEVLKTYLEKYGLKGGIVRFDKNSDELCICTDNYNDDITSDSWKLLGDMF